MAAPPVSWVTLTSFWRRESVAEYSELVGGKMLL